MIKNNDKYRPIKSHRFQGLLKKANKDHTYLHVLENENPFLADAIKGYQQYPEEIKVASSLKKKVKGKTVLKLISVLGIVVMAVLLYFNNFFLEKRQQNVQFQSLPDTTTKIFSVRQIVMEMFGDSLLLLTPTISKKSQHALDQFENKCTRDELMHIQKKLAFVVGTNDSTYENISKYYKKLPSTYLYDLKVVIYQKLKKGKQRINDEGTLSPRYENYEKVETDERGVQWVVLSYMDLLNEAMNKFSNGYYQNALNDFHYLLQWNENDLNALFYGGLCYYNRQEYGLALNFFEKILDDNSVNFLQETVWYKALTLLNLNRTEEAEKLLLGIAKSNGFYSQQAKSLLQQLKHGE